jgi:DNA replication protein DnaC
MSRYGSNQSNLSITLSGNLKTLYKAIFPRFPTALLDRLTHHCHIIEAGNESYRFQHSSAANKARIQSRERTRRLRETEEVVQEERTIN